MSQRLFGLKILAAAAVVGLGAFTSSVTAATKDLSAFGWMAEMDTGVDLTVLNTSGNTITLILEKSATFTNGVNSLGEFDPLRIVFRQVANTAVTHIAIADENILNDSGTAWSGFRFIIEGGLSNNGNMPKFDASASGGFSDGTQFPNAQFLNGDKELSVNGGTVPSGTFPANLYQPGEAGNLVIEANPFSSGSLPQSFVFKEQPIPGGGQPPVIPLPAAAWTSLSGLLGLGLISNAKNLKKMLS